jgi:hypothetical protein
MKGTARLVDHFTRFLGGLHLWQRQSPPPCPLLHSNRIILDTVIVENLNLDHVIIALSGSCYEHRNGRKVVSTPFHARLRKPVGSSMSLKFIGTVIGDEASARGL